MAIADRIIVPLDVSTAEHAIALVERLPAVTFWKVGLELFVSTGPSILTELKQRHKKIFLDLKFHDIPNTVAGACQAAAQGGVDLLTVHAAGGREMLKAAQQAAVLGATAGDQPLPTLLAVTLLTSLNTRSLAFDLKIPLELPEYVLHMALLAKDSGLGGAVCSPQEVEQLRRICGPDFVLVCPGVRPLWAAANDQSRTLTPSNAIKAGASYLVIGRPITDADDPLHAFEQICAEIAAVV